MLRASHTLNSSKTNTAGRGMDKNVIALLNVCSHNQSTITCRRSNKQASSLFERPTIRNRQESVLGSADLGCKSTLRRAKDTRSYRKLGVGTIARCGDDCASEFSASNPGKCCIQLVSDKFIYAEGHTRLVLVFSLDLQNVEKVGCCGVYLNEILIC